MAAFQGAAYFAIFFFLQLHCKTKPDLYPQNILIATGKNYALTKLLEKSTARIAVAFPLAVKKIFAIRRVFKKKPRRDALFKKQAVCCNKGGNTRRTDGSIHEEGTLGNS